MATEPRPSDNYDEVPICPLCKSPELRDLGIISHYLPALIGSVEVDLGAATYRLIACTNCAFQFKYPKLPTAKLLAGYAATEDAHWGIDPDPRLRGYDLLQSLADRLANGHRILDIGCANGALLRYFGAGWDRYGVEPSSAASSAATASGIQMIGRTLAEIAAEHAGSFNVITAIDVVEHIAHPIEFFRQVRNLLAPGGIAIIVTGDTQALTWRLQKAHYWYSAYAGHVSFFSRPTLDFLGQIIGLEYVTSHRMTHSRSRLRRHFRQTVTNVAWLALATLERFLPPIYRPRTKLGAAPDWSSAADHILYVMRRTDRIGQVERSAEMAAERLADDPLR